MTDAAQLRSRQESAQRVYDRMLDSLLQYDCCQKLKIEDAKFLARRAQDIAFDEFSK